ncbi:outer membrane beta-barrel protein [Neolewinella antarctica]|uniref:Long-subunit fatty acid transport protein n=1 Tax=Neolewinella antarctica TaxID=442734 RepID=A0ABX0X9G2_9BACT|nr:outer membrane beta-barrel protein [Neolewinella antarctica]NJC25905.1 long-subunit fatty acid transport protein [Neolewinella antarctica]
MHFKQLPFVFLLLAATVSPPLAGQAWGELFIVRSVPLDDQFSPDFSFRDLTDANYGIGLGLSYSVDRVSVGLDTRYVEYKPRIEGLEVRSFRIGPRVDYVFSETRRFIPYVGLSGAIHQIKAIVGPSLSTLERQGNTYVGFGVRAGGVLMLTEQAALRLGAEYSYLNDFPHLDFTLGFAYDFGDF